MEKIKKVFSLFVTIIFLYQNTAFCFPEINSALRPPLYFSQSTLEFRSGDIDTEKLGEPEIIFEDDIISPVKLLSGEWFRADPIIELLGISVDSELEMLLVDVLLELIANGLYYRLTRQKKAGSS